MRAVWCVLLLACCGSGELSASTRLQSQPFLREFTVADGLPTSIVNGITEDRFGYLWLASNDGLVRFDGRDFRTWRTEDGLRDNQLHAVHVDARNQLWVGTDSAGMAMLSPDRRTFRHFDRNTHPLISSSRVWVIESTPDGAIWFGTDSGGLYRLAPDHSLRRFLPDPADPRSLPSAAVGQLLVTDEGQLWVGTQNGVARWTGADFERIPLDQLPSPRTNILRQDHQGRIWVGTSVGMAVIQADGQVVRPSLDSAPGEEALQLLLQDSHGQMWFDSMGGLGLSRDGSQVETVPIFSAVTRGKVRPSWIVAFEDREGGLWFGSLDNGLWYASPNWRQFVQLQGDRDNRVGIRNPIITGMSASSRDGVWMVGSAARLDHLDPQTGQVDQVLPGALANTWLRSVAEDGQGGVWIGTHGQLMRYDQQTRQTRHWRARDPHNPAPDGTISRLVRCNQGQMWVYSGEGGLQLRDASGGVVWQRLGGAAPLDMVHTLICGPDDQLWLGGADGVMRFDPGLGEFVSVPGSPRTSVHAMRFSVDGVLWLAHHGALGLHLWRDGRLEAMDRIDQTHGYPFITANGLVLDVQGVAWVSSSRGLYRVDLANRAVRKYGVHDGLLSQEFMRGTLGMTSRGQVYAASTFGLLVLDPAHLVPSGLRQLLTVERVTVRQGDSVLDLTHQTPLVIEPGMRDLQVNARLLSFADGASNLYRFKLEGFDPDWVEVGNSGERVFSSLRPGHYRLRMQARTADNMWSAVQELDFRVLPPWWASKAGIVVYLLLAIGVLGIGLGMYRRRLRRINELHLAQRTRELAEQSSLAKTRFLANLGHEVRTPLTGVLGMSELLLAAPLGPREQGYARSIQLAGEHLLRLVNDALDLARIEAGKLELQAAPLDLRAQVDQVVGLMSPLAAAKGLAFVRMVELPSQVTVTGDAVRLRQIMLNLLANAIKFTACGQVTLRVSLSATSPGVCIAVTDTGPGIAEAQKQRLFRRFEQADGARTAERYGGSGLGLAICNELAMAMGGGIRVDSQPGRGSCFTVDLPLAWAQSPATAGTGAGTPSPTASAAGQGLSILLVEDEATIAEVIVGLLQVRGHQVVHAGHALAALGALAGNRFDIALLDLDLPGLDGLALASQLRGMGHELPLLAVTARADADAQAQAQASGFNGFLRKPVTGQLLDTAIRAAMVDAVRQRAEDAG